MHLPEECKHRPGYHCAKRCSSDCLSWRVIADLNARPTNEEDERCQTKQCWADIKGEDDHCTCYDAYMTGDLPEEGDQRADH